MVAGIDFKITQKEIGRRLNLSVMTVSKALRGHPDISEATRNQVLAEAKKHNYIPNLLAKSLARTKTKVIGFLFPDITFDFAHNIVNGAKSVLMEHDYLTILGLTSWDIKEERREVDMMLGRQVDGIICQPIAQQDMETYQRVVDLGLPMVFVGNSLTIPEANWVALDGYDASQQMMSHLLSLGHRRIAFLAPDVFEKDVSLFPRFQGYQDALIAQGIGIDPQLVDVDKVGSVSYIDGIIDRLMGLENPPTAILVAIEVLGYQVMHCLLKRKLRIPQDVAVASLGGLSFSNYEMISLSTVDECSMEMGKLAAQIILDQIDDKSKSPVKKLVKGTFIARRSTLQDAE